MVNRNQKIFTKMIALLIMLCVGLVQGAAEGSDEEIRRKIESAKLPLSTKFRCLDYFERVGRCSLGQIGTRLEKAEKADYDRRTERAITAHRLAQINHFL